MFFRVIVTTLLLGSTIALHFGKNPYPLSYHLIVLYGLIAGIFILSFVYAVFFNRIKEKIVFAYAQVAIDTVVVSLVIYVTGGSSSIFSFLYLVVIIYSSMLVFRKGSMLAAALCSIQYGVMACLEYNGALDPFIMDDISAVNCALSHVLYKITVTMAACFAVAFLSSLLSEQTRKTKNELLAMEDHVKRVEKMAGIGEMAAGLAHEIRNPLASLRGSIQLLGEDIYDAPDHEKLMQIILRETDRLSSLVSNFLLFAKPPVGKVKAIELDKALTETIELFEKDSGVCDGVLITKTLIPNVWIAMDSLHLYQVVWNLLLNAAESIKGGGNINIEMYSLKNSLVDIKIADNGCGISKKRLMSIFDPFFTTKAAGTGLGLSIVHRILESYGGRIDVESDLDRGTIFTLKLKRIDPPT